MPPTSNAQAPIALVTGASRGAGKGIAIALGEQGYTVYITGRSQQEGQQHAGQAPLPGTITATAADIDAAGGQGIAVACDHSDDAQVAALFEQIKAEQGRLDILVNNATYLHDDLIKPGGFWTKSLALADILNVGLRSAYVASYHAAAMMSQQQSGLIVNTGSPGASCYMHGAAYGAQKAGLDKMTWDMAHDLRPFNVSVVSLWMGMLKTERSAAAAELAPEHYAALLEMAESPQFSGDIIAALYRDPKLLERSGQTWIGAELGVEYGIHDRDGKQPGNHARQLGQPLQFSAAVVE